MEIQFYFLLSSVDCPSGMNYAPNWNGSPNKFVDQGYNNWNESHLYATNNGQNNSNDGARIVPIKLEDGHPYLNGPASQTPTVIQK